MKKIKRLLLLALLFVIAAFAVLCAKVGYPHHRINAFVLLALSFVPLGIAWHLNRRRLRVNTKIVKKKTRPWIPYLIVASILIVFLYVAHTLAPVKESPLTKMTSAELISNISDDLQGYLTLRGAIDNLVSRFKENGLLSRDVSTLSKTERAEIKKLWLEGVVLFLECDMLKEKYAGFHMVDYKALPSQHADSFFLAYAIFITQYRACLNIYRMVRDNEFMETLLNESHGQVPAGTYSHLKKLLLKPALAIRANAGTVYYELVKKDLTFDKQIVDDFEMRRKDFFKTLVKNPHIYLENPLDVLEESAFKAWFPLQKGVALQMSNIRAATRDFLITPEMLKNVKHRLEPGDILLQRRSWYMTNVGIPGFWPHAAMYIGSYKDLEAFFGEDIKLLKEKYPKACAKLQEKDAEGHAYAVIEAIKDGVIMQSLEHSANCDFLAVIRPKLTKARKLAVVMSAFSHYQKPYDMNFDFATDNELVCSELVYKAYNAVDSTLFAPEIVNGRLLLPPNLMAEQVSRSLKQGKSKFALVLFLDANEKDRRVFEAGIDEFMKSYNRPKWYILQN